MKVNVLPISDIHGHFEIFDYIVSNFKSKYADVDLVTISGDIHFGYALKPIELVDAMESFQRAINVPIVMIQGNHDYFLTDIFIDSKDIHVLHNSGIELLGLKFWGSPMTPTFGNWNHMMDDGVYGLDNIFKNMMPDNLDILLSHGPPMGYSDTCRNGAHGNPPDLHLGSQSLTDGIMMHKPRYVFSGHIHTGIRHSRISNGDFTTEVYNCSCLDEEYEFLGDNPAPEIISIDNIHNS